MNVFSRVMARLFTSLLHLYPWQFEAEFGEEMQVVFADVIEHPRESSLALLFFRELRDFPGSWVTVFFSDRLRGGTMATQNEFISPSTKWQALIGSLPFLAFGVASMLDKLDQLHPYLGVDSFLAFYVVALVGLLIGWSRGFPLWSYSYLGWSLVFIWWWSSMTVNGVYWGFYILLPFGITVLIALLWTHSLAPIKKLFRDIWNDWTRLSLAMFALGGFASLIYDENHHPQLLWFMLITTLAISAGAWFFLRCSSLKGRVFSIIGSFVASVVISSICEATWDFHAYHGLPEPTRTWYQSLGVSIMILTFWLALLFWPAIIAAIRKLVLRRRLG
jgi:hypothetical protein